MDGSYERRIYNVDGHGLEEKQAHFNLWKVRRFPLSYDQHFDSQPSRASYENSQDLIYDEKTQHRSPVKKAETSVSLGATHPQKNLSYHHFSTQRDPGLKELHNSHAQLEQIEEEYKSTFNRSTILERNMQQPNLNESFARSENFLQSIKMGGGDALIHSTKLEESVKAHNRQPIHIQGLTDFLTDQHYSKTGVYKRELQALFNFWKNYVSIAYREWRNQKRAKNARDDVSLTTSPKKKLQKRGQDAKPIQKPDLLGKEHQQIPEINENKENYGKLGENKKLSETYRIYGLLYELDVVYTVDKDIQEELHVFKVQQLKAEQEQKKAQQTLKNKKEQEIMVGVLSLFYDDLIYYTVKELEKPEEDTTPQFLHVTLNPVESIDADKREPAKPKLSEEQKKKQQDLIEKQLREEMNLMRSIGLYSLEINKLTNEPQQLFQLYKDCKEKREYELIWPKGDEDVKRILFEFFSPEKTLKRIIIVKGRSNSFKHCSLFGFYQQLKKRERLLNLIDWQKTRLREDEEFKDCPYKQAVELIRQKYQQVNQLSNSSSIEMIAVVYDNMIANEKAAVIANEIAQKEKQESMKLIKKKPADKQAEEVNRLDKLARPKDKWKRLRILKQLRAKFPHDILIAKMIKEEEKSNRLFRYPQEYDLYDEENEVKIKYQVKGGLETKELDNGKAKTMLDTFKVMDDKDLYYLNQKLREQRRLQREFEGFILDKVNAYLEMIKKRLQGQEQTLRTFVSRVYHEARAKFPQYVNQKFPWAAYGTKKSSETYKKSYPFEFKQYFFQMVKSYVRTKRGYQRAKRPIPTFIIPGGKRCHVHAFHCPEGCQLVTYNKKVILKHAILRRRQRDPKTFRSRVWRRQDFKSALKDVFLLDTELENCTFEPEAGTLSKNMKDTLRANPNLGNSEIVKEPEPDAFFLKLGKNFERSHPEVYKAGVLKRAKLKYSQGKYEESMNTLAEGFNIASIRRYFDSVYREKWHKQQREKEAAAQKKEEVKQPSTSQSRLGVTFQARNNLQKEDPDELKKRPEEDFDNKKLQFVLREAFDLIMILVNRKSSVHKQIGTIRKQQTELKRQMRGFSQYKRSMTRTDLSKGEKILFKTIMCPLKERCSKVQNHRWPISNIKTVKKFGEHCPFAHHPMELNFPESVVSKLAASYSTIKSITQKIDEEKSRAPFKPTGGLFDCVGCNSRSGQHMGGPCNLCRYKEMADESSKKFNDKKRKASLTRSMERRQTSQEKEVKYEMSTINKALDLDNNYTKKFGLFKKACVLFFYGRYNDAFEEIAKAVKIIQDQKEIEKQKQLVLEKRWRFKLGLDDGFELPIPIEQIDPAKVDEKFLKKMDLGNQVALSTLKLFIENVHPSKNEEFSKHAFLNQLIEDYYMKFEDAIQDKMDTIKMMKKQVERLDELADRLEGNGSPGSSPERAGEKGGSLRTTSKNKLSKLCPNLVANRACPQAKIPKCPFVHSEEELQRLNREAIKEAERTGNERKHYQMCEKVLRNEKCTLVLERVCPYEHNPILFDLIPPENKIKNLNGVIASQSYKLKHMKPLEPWRPAKSGDIEHTDLMDMQSKKRRKEGEEEEDDEGMSPKKKRTVKKSIFERENVFRKPYESAE